MKLQTKHPFSINRMLLRIGAAILFGAAFWLTLEYLQPGLLTPLYGYPSCCERCKNILFDRAQPALAAGAAVAFLSVSFLNARGWKGAVKVLLICWLAFQLHSALTLWGILRREECTALYVTRSIPMLSIILLGFQLLFDGIMWSGICAVPILTIRTIRANVFANDDELQRLDL